MGKEKKLPEHVGIIMDGNGRWAKKRMMPRVFGHNQGMTSMQDIVRKASNMGIKYLTVYAFSTENWKRTEEEIKGIFSLLIKYVNLNLDELFEENVKVRVFGDYSVIPKAARESLDKTLEKTKDCTGMEFNIALNYGGRKDIVDAVNEFVKENPDKKITEEELSKYLYTGKKNGNIPDLDLIIRTSGEKRLSNFLLWQSAYSELAFTDTLWPDFEPEEFEDIIYEYMNRDRRFGGRKDEN